MDGRQGHENLVVVVDFLRSVHAAGDARQLATEIEHFVRNALPARCRDRRTLSNFSRSLEAALEQEMLSGLAIDDATAALSVSSASQSQGHPGNLESVLETGAALLDGCVGAHVSGASLRICVESVRDAAHAMAERMLSLGALKRCRELETAGSPAALLFSVQGKPLWCNAALGQLIFRRELDRDAVQRHARDLALEVLQNYWRSGFMRGLYPDVSRYNEATGLHLTANLLNAGESPLESVVRVTASEARRKTVLSPREQQIALLLAQCDSYKQVALNANVSLDTIRTYVRRIYRKLAVNSRFALKQRLAHDGLHHAANTESPTTRG